jgi:hypothetical protein
MMPCEIAPRGQNEICVDVATKGRAAIPLLRYDAPRHQNGWSASLKGSDGFFHRIEPMAEFYGVLGLTREASAETPPDEFIWERYIRDGAPLSLACLQSQYAVYLYGRCAEFRELYALSYEERIRSCELDDIAHGSDHCMQCPMRPATR